MPGFLSGKQVCSNNKSLRGNVFVLSQDKVKRQVKVLPQGHKVAGACIFMSPFDVMRGQIKLIWICVRVLWAWLLATSCVIPLLKNGVINNQILTQRTLKERECLHPCWQESAREKEGRKWGNIQREKWNVEPRQARWVQGCVCAAGVILWGSRMVPSSHMQEVISALLCCLQQLLDNPPEPLSC